MSNALKSTDTEYRQGFRRLLAGLLLALALTLAAFSMVWFGLAVLAVPPSPKSQA